MIIPLENSPTLFYISNKPQSLFSASIFPSFSYVQPIAYEWQDGLYLAWASSLLEWVRTEKAGWQAGLWLQGKSSAVCQL